MCCDGSLFHTVRLQPRDSAKALAALGLKLKRKRGLDVILQPCPAFGETGCSIYLSRPERCRLFECRQLRAVLAEELPESAAAGKIAEARERIAQIEQLLKALGEKYAKGPLSVRVEKALAAPVDPDDDACEQLRSELLLKFGELDDLLDREFRVH